jgi:hypothetical protein
MQGLWTPDLRYGGNGLTHRTRTPLRVWFWAIYLVANDKRGLSALQSSKKLEVSYYVAWNVLHKLRTAMKERDSAYELRVIIEMDESFFGSGVGGDKRGRGTKKTPLIVEASTAEAAVGFDRIRVVEHVDKETIAEIVPKPAFRKRGDAFEHDVELRVGGVRIWPVINPSDR